MIGGFKELLYAILVLAGLICGLFFINQTNAISIFLLIVSVMASLAFGLEKKFKSFHFIAAVIHAGLNLIWIISGNYYFYCVAMITGLLVSIYILIAQLIVYERHSEHRKSLKIVTGVVSGVLILASAATGIFLSAVAINPNVLISPMQKKFNAVNSFSPANETTETKWGSNATYINDICYGNTYPNSYLDIYLSPVEGENKPTYFYIHGGGYVWGDKIGGDPNTRDSGLEWYIDTFLQNGINVVSPNYCFAPEYSYPTQVVQLNECLDFLVQHGAEYGISMDQVIVGGGSAGGNLAGMLGLVCTNQKIAAELGTAQYLTKENVAACVFVSALINNEDFSVTHDAVMDWLFLQCGRSAFNCGFLQGNDKAHLTNIIAQADENFPPSYISDGNTGTFYSMAEAFHEKLDSLNVKNQLNLYPKEEEVLLHGFETTSGSPSAQDNMEKVQIFLKDILLEKGY